MKILYIITKSNWGGAQRHVFDLATFSKKNGHDVVVALGGSGILNDKLKEQGIETRVIGSIKRDINITEDAASLIDIFKIVRKEKPDILHLHSPKAAGLGALSGRVLRVPKIIYTVHGWAFNENRPLSQKIVIAFFCWLTMVLSTHVVTISETELAQSQMFPFVKRKLHMIYLGITPPKFFSADSTRLFLQSKTSLPLAKQTIIGTIAELHPNKGLIYAINAIQKVLIRHPNLIYFIIAEGEQKAYLESLIKEKVLEKNITLTGYVENAAEYLRGFSIFLLPSIKEGLPYTLIEAGYAGLPVIATAVGGIPEIIDDMKSGIIIQPKKSQEIAHSLEFLIEHKKVQKEYGKALQDKVKSTFNIDKMIESIMNLYISR